MKITVKNAHKIDLATLSHEDLLSLTHVGAIVGATSGAHLGNSIDNKHSRNTAVEYSIVDTKGTEMVLIQPYNKEDRLVDAGQSCRIVSGGESYRILPADHLAQVVTIPAATRVE